MTAPRTALTLKEAAASMGVSLSTFRNRVYPTVKTVRLGRKVLVRPADLDEWLAKHGTLGTLDTAYD